MLAGDDIVTHAVQKLGEFLIEEAATLSYGVKVDLVFVRDELIWMQSFLKDAEQKQGDDDESSISSRVAEIRSIALKTEDIVDAYVTEINDDRGSSKGKMLQQKYLCGISPKRTSVYDIGKQINAVKERLSGITRKREDYGIGKPPEIVVNDDAASEDQMRNSRRRVSFAASDDFYLLGDDFYLLEKRLCSPEESGRRVISISGMGGLGKTSLARKLYNTNKGSFELSAWVCVSQEWNTKHLLVRIIKSLKVPTYQELGMLESMTDDDTRRYLLELLKDKRYLMVIDDIWDEEAWDCLTSVLPDSQNGSRVILTTRNVFVSGEEIYVHKLRCLPEHESWELFCRRANFSEQNGACPQDLEQTAKEIVAMLGGLPLAITVMGGLLSGKQRGEWPAIKKHIWREQADKSIHISTILDLSYNDLPRELKRCFLYMGIFPQDYVIPTDKLVQLWIAEELIPRVEGMGLEELAESYIQELNARSLIQVTRTDFKLDSTCRVHDLLQDLAVHKAKDLDFFHIYEESLNPSIEPVAAGRIAFRSGFEKYMAIDNNHSYPQVHTLSFLGYKTSLNHDDVAKLVTLFKTRFESLKVLDLEGVRFVSRKDELEFFKAMVKLVHLRYFKLYITDDISELPESIGNLLALEVLDVLGADVKRMQLPTDIYKLKHLRHLNGNFRTKTGDVIEDLTNLHTLNDIDINGWLQNEESDELALKAFSKLHSIRILSVLFENANYRLSIEPLFSCKNLFSLQLKGSIKSLPMELHESLPCLRYLGLYEANFVQDPLPALEKLSNLLELYLDGFKVESLIITATGFDKLGSLSIRDIPNDMSLQIVEVALPSLKKLHIDPLINFTLPERLKNLTK